MRLVPGSERVFGEDADPTQGQVRWAADKSLWIVPGAAHVDLHAFAPAEYERRVGSFMQERLRAPA